MEVLSSTSVEQAFKSGKETQLKPRQNCNTLSDDQEILTAFI